MAPRAAGYAVVAAGPLAVCAGHPAIGASASGFCPAAQHEEDDQAGGDEKVPGEL
ncbi:MAG TPA: hypothetical protein VHQ43_05335 [Solirubrobacterales bacterium]|nr:hypothetical protein [Solirubrobacterales bacterium]